LLTFSEEPAPFFNSWSLPQCKMYDYDIDIHTVLQSYTGRMVNSNCIGTLKQFNQLINDVTNEVRTIRSKRLTPYNEPIPLCDQIVMNKLFIYNKINYVSILPHVNNIIVTNLVEGEYQYKDGQACVNDRPISILHQYDRNPTLFKLFLDQFAV